MKGLDLLMDLGKVSKTEHKVNNEHVPSTDNTARYIVYIYDGI